MRPLWPDQPGHMKPSDSGGVTERVAAIAAPIVRALGLELVEVESLGRGPAMVLRIFIDKPGGVNVQDCEQVHQSLSHALDVEDPIPHSYTLEVSSPGLDRPLKRRQDYARALGKQVSLKLRQPCDGQWRLVGRLVDVNDQGVTLAMPASKARKALRGTGGAAAQTEVEWEAIAAARLEVEW